MSRGPIVSGATGSAAQSQQAPVIPIIDRDALGSFIRSTDAKSEIHLDFDDLDDPINKKNLEELVQTVKSEASIDNIKLSKHVENKCKKAIEKLEKKDADLLESVKAVRKITRYAIDAYKKYGLTSGLLYLENYFKIFAPYDFSYNDGHLPKTKKAFEDEIALEGKDFMRKMHKSEYGIKARTDARMIDLVTGVNRNIENGKQGDAVLLINNAISDFRVDPRAMNFEAIRHSLMSVLFSTTDGNVQNEALRTLIDFYAIDIEKNDKQIPTVELIGKMISQSIGNGFKKVQVWQDLMDKNPAVMQRWAARDYAIVQDYPDFVAGGFTHKYFAAGNADHQDTAKFYNLLQDLKVQLLNDNVVQVKATCVQIDQMLTASYQALLASEDSNSFIKMAPIYSHFIDSLNNLGKIPVSYSSYVNIDGLNNNLMNILDTIATETPEFKEIRDMVALKSLQFYRMQRSYTSIPDLEVKIKSPFEDKLIKKMGWIAYNIEETTPAASDKTFIHGRHRMSDKKVAFKVGEPEKFVNTDHRKYSYSPKGDAGQNLGNTYLKQVLIDCGRAVYDKARQLYIDAQGIDQYRVLHETFTNPREGFTFDFSRTPDIAPQVGSQAYLEKLAREAQEMGNPVPIATNAGNPRPARIKEGATTSRPKTATTTSAPKQISATTSAPKPKPAQAEPTSGWEDSFFNRHAAKLLATGIGAVGVIGGYLWHNRNRAEETPEQRRQRAQAILEEDAREAEQEANRQKLREQEKLKQAEAARIAHAAKIQDLTQRVVALKQAIAPRKAALDALRKAAAEPLKERYKYVYAYFNRADLSDRNKHGITLLSRDKAIKPMNDFINAFAGYENMLSSISEYEPDLTEKTIDAEAKKIAALEAIKFPALPALEPLKAMVAYEKEKHEDRKKITDTVKFAEIDTITDSYPKLSRPWHEMFGVDLSALKGEVKPPKTAEESSRTGVASVGATSSVLDQSGRPPRKPLSKPAPPSERKQRTERMKEYWVGQNPFVHSFCDNLAKLKNVFAAYDSGQIDGNLFTHAANYHIMRMCGALAEAALAHKNQNVNSDEIIALDGDPLVKSEIILGTNKLECEKIAQSINEIRHSCMHEFYNGNAENMTHELGLNLIHLFDPLREKIMQDCTTQIDSPITMPALMLAVDKLLPSRAYASLDPEQKKNMVRDQLQNIKELVRQGELSDNLSDFRNVAILRLLGNIGDIIKKDDVLKAMFRDRNIVDNFIKIRDLTGHLFGFEPHEMGVLEDSRGRLHYDHEYYDLVRDGAEVKPFAGRQRDRTKEFCPEPVHEEMLQFFVENIDLIIQNFTDINSARPRAHARRPLQRQQTSRLTTDDKEFDYEHE